MQFSHPLSPLAASASPRSHSSLARWPPLEAAASERSHGFLTHAALFLFLPIRSSPEFAISIPGLNPQ